MKFIKADAIDSLDYLHKEIASIRKEVGYIATRMSHHPSRDIYRLDLEDVEMKLLTLERALQ